MTRSSSALGLAATIGVGLGSRRFPVGVHVWDESLGDALYTVMVYFAVALARPGLRPTAIGAIALAISIAVEAFQLTGIPSRLPRILQIALGTTFAWHDVACYAMGAIVTTLAHRAVRGRNA